MMRIALLLLVLAVSACVPGPRRVDPETGKPVPSNLNFAYCEKIARETFDSGGLSYKLCPGYMPDGQPVEMF